MTLRQQLTLLLFVIGFGLSASPLLLMLGAHDLSSVFDCLVIDIAAEECVKYGDNFARVIYTTYIASGQQYLFVTVPLGMLMIAIGIVLTIIDEPKNTTKKKDSPN